MPVFTRPSKAGCPPGEYPGKYRRVFGSYKHTPPNQLDTFSKSNYCRGGADRRKLNEVERPRMRVWQNPAWVRWLAEPEGHARNTPRRIVIGLLAPTLYQEI